MKSSQRWMLIAGAGALVAACTLSFDDSEVKPQDDASAGGTGGTVSTGGVAGEDASSGGGPSGGGGAPSGGGGAPIGGGGSPSGGGGAPSGGGGTPSGGGGAPTGGGGAPTGGGGAPTGGGGAPTGGGGAPTGGGGAPTGGGGAPTGGGGAPTGGGGAPSGGGGTGAVGPKACALGSDDFNDGVIDSMWNTWGPNTPVETNGQLRVQPQGSQVKYSGIVTKIYTDLRECAVWIEVPQVLTSTTETSVYMVVSSSADGDIAFVQWETGLLHVGLENQGKMMQYSASADRWWRINSAAGTTKYETSPDGKAWTTKHTSATPPAWSSGYVEIGAGTWQVQQPNIGTAVFDNFNK